MTKQIQTNADGIVMRAVARTIPLDQALSALAALETGDNPRSPMQALQDHWSAISKRSADARAEWHAWRERASEYLPAVGTDPRMVTLAARLLRRSDTHAGTILLDLAHAMGSTHDRRESPEQVAARWLAVLAERGEEDLTLTDLPPRKIADSKTHEDRTYVVGSGDATIAVWLKADEILLGASEIEDVGPMFGRFPHTVNVSIGEHDAGTLRVFADGLLRHDGATFSGSISHPLLGSRWRAYEQVVNVGHVRADTVRRYWRDSVVGPTSWTASGKHAPWNDPAQRLSGKPDVSEPWSFLPGVTLTRLPTLTTLVGRAEITTARGKIEPIRASVRHDANGRLQHVTPRAVQRARKHPHYARPISMTDAALVAAMPRGSRVTFDDGATRVTIGRGKSADLVRYNVTRKVGENTTRGTTNNPAAAVARAMRSANR